MIYPVTQRFAVPLLPEQLLAIPWMEALNATEREWAATVLRVTTVGPAELVCRVGSRPTHWVGVLDGLVKMSSYGDSGQTVTFAGFPAGGWFGEGTILKQETYQYDIQALQGSRLVWMPVAAFRHLLSESIAFNGFLMRQFNERLGQFIAWKAATTTLQLDERLAQALANLFNPALFPRVGDRLKISQQELAYLVGTSRQQINEALPLLRDAGAAEAEYGGIRLLDLYKLRAYKNRRGGSGSLHCA